MTFYEKIEHEAYLRLLKAVKNSGHGGWKFNSKKQQANRDRQRQRMHDELKIGRPIGADEG